MIRHLGRALLLALALVAASRGAQRAPPAARPGETGASPAPARLDLESDHARTRAVIEEVLARSEFADVHQDSYAYWRRVILWIASVFGAIASTLGSLPVWLLWTIVVWMVLALAALLAHLLYTLWQLLGTSSRGAPSGDASRRREGELLGIRDLDFDTVYAEANRLLTAGDWLSATKHLYVAAILWLDRQHWITFKPAKTNRDYLGELRRASRLEGIFGRLTQCFELIVYGGRPATTSTSHDMAKIVEGLLHEPARAIKT